MPWFRTSVFYSALLGLTLPAHAALQCDKGSPVSVSGRVTTLNFSPTRNAGQICLTFIDMRGEEVFDQCGAVLANVVSSDPATGRSILNHTALFSKTQAFMTRNDVAQVTGVLAVDDTGTPCAFSVVEKITQIAWSAGFLQAGQGNVTAQGSISFCPDKNLNTFTLSGEACLAKKYGKDD